ncbi:PspC domain-containing protein [Nocardioides sp. TF02-7]|uniref:PspC domain-containing protein n=1 Tax=Nocardioides sp. TF02-7 TaxID=2917724 RepID=UPI001F0581A2|nr:PspC domain-containing protein [Nocardioides sp. TF02-7]UMG93361.1 PspC domain-containing protein [Nocardioides sp. TF02-7]
MNAPADTEPTGPGSSSSAGGPGGPDRPDEPGPRVTRDEVRDLGRIRRSRTDRKLAGVAAGVARHFDIDPLIVRVAFVVLVFFGGGGVLAYAAGWLFIPEEETEDANVRLDDRSRTVVLVAAAGLCALSLVGDSFGGWDFPWPLAVVGIVVVAVLAAKGKLPAPPPSAAPGAPQGPGGATYAGYEPGPPPPAPARAPRPAALLVHRRPGHAAPRRPRHRRPRRCGRADRRLPGDRARHLRRDAARRRGLRPGRWPDLRRAARGRRHRRCHHGRRRQRRQGGCRADERRPARQRLRPRLRGDRGRPHGDHRPRRPRRPDPRPRPPVRADPRHRPGGGARRGRRRRHRGRR